MTTVRLRPYAPEDAVPLYAVWVASWNATMPEIDFATRREWFETWLAVHLSGGGVVICATDDDDAIVGFVSVERRSGQAARSGHIEQLAVSPLVFGQGVGSVLLDAAKALCPDGITLRVNQENPRAVAFYRRAGFVVSAEGVNPHGRRKVFDMAWPDAGR